MKFYTLFFLLIPLFTFSQAIPNKTNTIIVRNVSFDQCVNMLLDMGYRIDKIDKDYQTVKTEFKKSENRKIKTYRISINVRVRDSVAVIASVTRDDTGIMVDKEQDIQIDYSPSKLLMKRELFGEMDTYAKKLNPIVEYDIR